MRFCECPLLAKFLSLWLLFASAQAQKVEWIWPPSAAADSSDQVQLNLQIGSTQTLQWRTSLPTSTVGIFHTLDPGVAGYSYQLVTNTTSNNYTWVVKDLRTSPSHGPTWWMIVRCDSSIFADTVNFNITTNATSPRSSSSSSSSLGLTTNTIASTLPVSLATTTVTSTPIPEQTSLTGGAIAGIVIGCLVGFAAIGGLVLWVLSSRRGGSKSTSKLDGLHEKPEREHTLAELEDRKRAAAELGTGPDIPTELPQTTIVQELDASVYSHR